MKKFTKVISLLLTDHNDAAQQRAVVMNLPTLDVEKILRRIRRNTHFLEELEQMNSERILTDLMEQIKKPHSSLHRAA